MSSLNEQVIYQNGFWGEITGVDKIGSGILTGDVAIGNKICGYVEIRSEPSIPFIITDPNSYNFSLKFVFHGVKKNYVLDGLIKHPGGGDWNVLTPPEGFIDLDKFTLHRPNNLYNSGLENTFFDPLPTDTDAGTFHIEINNYLKLNFSGTGYLEWQITNTNQSVRIDFNIGSIQNPLIQRISEMSG